MKKPNLILHIGTEKTGTSSIQTFLDLNRNELTKNNIHFVSCAGNTNNRKLPAAMLDDAHAMHDDFFLLNCLDTKEKILDFKESFFSDFEKEIEGLNSSVHTVIISSEHFHSRINNDHLISKLKTFLQKYFDRITIICYLREQSQVCESWYSTALKNGHCSYLSQFAQECHPDNNYYNYFENLKHWGHVFGLDSMIVRLFEKKEFHNEDLLDDFVYLIDKELVGKLNKGIKKENESLTSVGQLIALSLNQALKNPNTCDSVSIRKLQLAKSKLYTKLSGKGACLTVDDYERIEADFKISNALLSQLYFNNRKPLFCKRDKSKLPHSYEFKNESEVLVDIIMSIMNFSISFKNSDADKLRDIALSLGHQKKYDNAYYLMSLAHEIRPSGKLIKEKLDEYKSKIND
jgi:hypothetical protein